MDVRDLPNITSASSNEFGYAAIIADTDNNGLFEIVASAPVENNFDGAIYVIPINNIVTSIDVTSANIWHIQVPAGTEMEFGYSLAADENEIVVGAPGANGYTGSVFMIDGRNFGTDVDFNKLINYSGVANSGGWLGSAVAIGDYGIIVGMDYLNFNAGGVAYFFKEESTNVANLFGPNGFIISGNELGKSYFGLSILNLPDINGDKRSELVVGAPALYSWDGAMFLIPSGCCYKNIAGFCLPRLDGTLVAQDGTTTTLECLTLTATESTTVTPTSSYSNDRTETKSHSTSETFTHSATRAFSRTLSKSKSKTDSFTETIRHDTQTTPTASSTDSRSKTASLTGFSHSISVTPDTVTKTTPTASSTDSRGRTASLTGSSHSISGTIGTVTKTTPTISSTDSRSTTVFLHSISGSTTGTVTRTTPTVSSTDSRSTTVFLHSISGSTIGSVTQTASLTDSPTSTASLTVSSHSISGSTTGAVTQQPP